MSPSYNVYRLRKPEQHEPEYLDWLCRTPAYVCEMTRFSKGVWKSRLRLYPDAFLDLAILCPPIDEQKAIIRYVALELDRTQPLSAQLTRSIDRLREYRAALISAAVTGKIDVRREVGAT